MMFGQLCNRILELVPDIKNDTDESDCPLTEWPCKTPYTYCDGMWNCPDGDDELDISCPGLSAYHCNGTDHFCLDIRTGNPLCLPKQQAGDGIDNCVGSMDEQNFCRTAYFDKPQKRFRCRNSNICITHDQICDCYDDCPEKDDETIACHWRNNGRETVCHKEYYLCRNGEYIAGTVS